MATTCGYGQVHDLRGKTLCIRGKTVIDDNRNLKCIRDLTAKNVTARCDIQGNQIVIGGEVCIDSDCNLIQNDNPNQIKYPKGFLCGLKLVYNDESTIDIENGACRDSADTKDGNICITSTLNVSLDGIGVNGLDSGSKSSNIWYAVFIIGDTSNINSPAGLLSINATSPTLPSGYNIFRRVGWIKTDGNNNIIPFFQKCTGKCRLYCWDTNLCESGLGVLFNQNSENRWKNVSLKMAVPPRGCLAHLRVDVDQNFNYNSTVALRATGTNDPNATANYATINDSTEIKYAPLVIRRDGIDKQNYNVQMCVGVDSSDNPSVDYVIYDTNSVYLSIYVTGFEDEL